MLYEVITKVNQKERRFIMGRSGLNFNLEVQGMKAVCPLGEVVGAKMIAEKKIPVISCEGGCFRGEIARMAAHLSYNFV